LTEAVRRHPYAVVLFDEIEKAHPEVFNVLLQILDDGRVTDAQGRTVDFKNTVLILTSNIGSPHLLEGISPDGEILETTRQKVLGELRTAFRPEFLNRIDDTVLFKPLSETELIKIVELQVVDIRKRLEEQHIDLVLTDEAAAMIAHNAYEPAYGARPLKRYLQRQLETRLARALIAGEVTEGSRVKLVAHKDGLKLELEKVAKGQEGN